MNKFTYLLAGITVFYFGCYVGTTARVKSDHLEYPVSYTESFYTPDFNLVNSEHYSTVKHFNLSFTKWGISPPLNIGSEEEISDRLNQVIRENDGDAAVRMVVSVNSTPVNDYLFIPKAISFAIGLVAIPLVITDPTKENAVLAASAIAVYLFTPGAATITLEGDVVRITGTYKSEIRDRGM
jgi:hypothetical protein